MRPLCLALLCTLALPLSAETSQQGWTLRRLTNAEVTPAITANAINILQAHRHDPYGTDIPFDADGKHYVGRIEQHYHPPGGAARPWGYHPGVSVFEVVDFNGLGPDDAADGDDADEADDDIPDALQPVRDGVLLLRRGSRGEPVRLLQQHLTSLGLTLVDDGIFGRLTDGAVRAFQHAAGIKVDGVVGPQTLAALDAALQP